MSVPPRPLPNEDAHGLTDEGLEPWQHIDRDWELTPRQVKAMRDQGQDVVLIDCRTDQERATCRIPDSLHVPLHELGSRLEELAEFEDRRVVVYCHLGQRSLQMAAVLRREGFENVRSLAGGIDLWALDIDPSMPRY